MFEELYLKSNSKIIPDKKLLSITKKKMCEEINKRKKSKVINFYKFATVAACLILVISVARNVVQKADKMSESISHSSNQTTHSFDNTVDSENLNISAKDNMFQPSDFTSHGAQEQIREITFFQKIMDFFSSIIQWLKELLF